MTNNVSKIQAKILLILGLVLLAIGIVNLIFYINSDKIANIAYILIGVPLIYSGSKLMRKHTGNKDF